MSVCKFCYAIRLSVSLLIFISLFLHFSTFPKFALFLSIFMCFSPISFGCLWFPLFHSHLNLRPLSNLIRMHYQILYNFIVCRKVYRSTMTISLIERDRKWEWAHKRKRDRNRERERRGEGDARKRKRERGQKTEIRTTYRKQLEIRKEAFHKILWCLRHDTYCRHSTIELQPSYIILFLCLLFFL